MATTLPATDAILTRLRQTKVVPVIVIDDADDAVPLAAALTEGGLACAEVTFRTTAAGEALRRICAENPDMLAGAGTVLTPEQAKRGARRGRALRRRARVQPRGRRLLPRARHPGVPRRLHADRRGGGAREGAARR